MKPEFTPSPLVEDLDLVMPVTEGVVPIWLLAVLALGAILVVWWFLRSRADRVTPAEPAEVTARRELKEAALLIGSEPGVLYLRAVATAMRRYLEGRFAIRAPSMTTREFLEFAADHKALKAHRDDLGRFLAVCDEAMFAERESTRNERQAMHGQAVAFVETSTKEGAQ